MTEDIRRFGFLLRQQPVCSQSPVKLHLGLDRHRELRAKHKLELGIDLLDDRCANAFNCLMVDSGCIGRPFPLDDEILQALKTLNVDVTIGFYKGHEVYLAQATVTCSTCPFNGQCTTSCATQDSYLNRRVKPESNPPENSLVPYEDLERGMYKALTPDDVAHCEYGSWSNETLPLDCLSPKQRQVVEMTVYQGLDQVVIADKLNITQQVVAKHLKSALDRLSEFGRARKALRDSKVVPQRLVDYYINNMTQQDIADKEGVKQHTISESISKWYIRKCT
jgi:DNA-binding CsgD family transcriptional regulator